MTWQCVAVPTRILVSYAGALPRPEYLPQLFDPDLPDGWQMFPDMTVDEYRRYAALRVDALNHTLRGIPEDQVRLPVCWGNHHGPPRDRPRP